MRTLLLQAAHDNARVLNDPAPLVFFLNFGESTLDHELRVHVRELADRNAAVDEINRAIDRMFRENGIEIAFRQLDVFLKNFKGQELQVPNMAPLPKASEPQPPLPPLQDDPV